MTSAFHPDRRTILALSGAAALLPGTALAQANPLSPAALNRLSDLTGFDTLPRDLLRGLGAALAQDTAASDALNGDDPLPDELKARVLTGLYSGVLPGDEGTRIGFSSALMWAAIEDSNNVISYCGGLPGYWADPPEDT